MIHRISIPTEDIIKEAIKLNSQDFRGLRILKPELDAAFEDFVMTADDTDAMNSQVKSVATEIYQKIKGYVTQWYVDAEVCYYVKSQIDTSSLEIILRNVVAYSILAWWYETRLPELSVSYRDKATLQLSALTSAVIPTFGKRKLRMF